MSKLKENWEMSSTYEKVSMIISGVLALAVIVLTSLGLFNVLPSILTNAVCMVLMAAIIMLQGFNFMRQPKTRAIAIVVISFAGIIMVFDLVSVIVLLMN